jgi:hypothetical protein
MKQQAAQLVKNEVATAKNAVKDSATSLKTQLFSSLKDQVSSKIGGNKDSSQNKKDNINDLKNKSEDIGKGLINGLFKRKPKTDTVNH